VTGRGTCRLCKIGFVVKLIHRIVVALENKIYVYNFSDLQLIVNKETASNPKGTDSC
jgi:hypothetical protein